MPEVSVPLPGYYRTRLVRLGPWVPVKIVERDGVVRAFVRGEAVDPLEIWTWCAGNPISAAEYEHMISVIDWAEKHAPDAPEARPREAIDHLRTKTPEF